MWSPRLTAAVRAAKAVPSAISSVYLLHDREGQPIKGSTIDTAWQRMHVKAKADGLTGRFTFHNLKHKGISDTKGDKLRSAGHRSASMMSIYDLKMDDVEATK